jgi:hypothetical protein
MSVTYTLQELFNAVVMAEETVEIPFNDAKSFNNLRTMLLRKYSRYRRACQHVGIESYDERFISCTFDQATKLGSFQLKWAEESKRVKQAYAVLKL